MLGPTYLATTLPDLLVKTYEASKVLNEKLWSFDAVGDFFLGILTWVGMRVTIPEDMKYFAVSEMVSLYIQK